jgi:AcrR family transcriptional regulator
MTLSLPVGTCSARDRLLDAAEALARTVGAANLTLDAVAQAAGVSKGGLLYHFPSKDALLAAMLERHVGRLDASCCRMLDTLPAGDAAAGLKAWVLSMLQPDPVRRDMGAAVLAAAANNPALLDCLRERHAARIGQVVASSGNFALATVIMLAVDGFVQSEIWRVSSFNDEQRAAIVQQLLQLADQAFGSAVAPEKNQ